MREDVLDIAALAEDLRELEVADRRRAVDGHKDGALVLVAVAASGHVLGFRQAARSARGVNRATHE